MMNKLIYTVPLFLLFFYNFCAAENWTDSIKYERGFQFKVGVYLTFEDWKNNDPIPPERILNKIDKDDPAYFIKLFNKITIDYLNENGEKQRIDPRSAFGYSTGDKVVKQDNIIQLIGAMTIYTKTTNVPMGQAPSFIPDANGIPQVSPNSPTLYGLDIKIDKSHIIDFQTGEDYKFTIKNFEKILKKDPVLFEEYEKSDFKPKDKVMVFMGKYNEKHSVYFKN